MGGGTLARSVIKTKLPHKVVLVNFWLLLVNVLRNYSSDTVDKSLTLLPSYSTILTFSK